jgi:hypothetical protein
LLLVRHQIIDDEWIKHNKKHEEFRGGKLILHHDEQGYMATALPEEVHNKQRKALHSNVGGRGNKMQRTLGKLNSLAMFLDVFAAANGNSHSIWNQKNIMKSFQ